MKRDKIMRTPVDENKIKTPELHITNAGNKQEDNESKESKKEQEEEPPFVTREFTFPHLFVKESQGCSYQEQIFDHTEWMVEKKSID